MSMFKIEDSFEFWYSEKKLCKTFYNPKMFKVVRCLTYSIEVFKTFKSISKTLVASLEKLGGRDGCKDRILESKFSFNMLFLSDVNFL